MTSYIVSGKYQELFNKSNDFDYILCASKMYREIGEMGLPSPPLAHTPSPESIVQKELVWDQHTTK